MNKLDVISKPTIASHSHSMITAAIKIISNLTPTHTVFTLCYSVLFILYFFLFLFFFFLSLQYNKQYTIILFVRMYILTPHSRHYYNRGHTITNSRKHIVVIYRVFGGFTCLWKWIASVNRAQTTMRQEY